MIQPAHLIQQLDAYLNRIYPPESNYLMSAEALRQTHVQFLTVQKDETIAGCGALVNHGDDGEIKRFFIQAEFRGRPPTAPGSGSPSK